MVALVDAAPALPSPGRWRDLSRAAVKAKARYDLAVAGTPGQDVDEALDGLLATLERIDEFTAIFDDLLRYTPKAWDRQSAGRHAAAHLRVAGQLASTPEYQRLRAALLERGYL